MTDSHKRASVRRQFRERVHDLNRRYREQWLRAERLEAELRQLRGRWFAPVLGWLRLLKRAVWPRPAAEERLRLPPPRFLEERRWHGTARVSVIVPFRDRLDLLRVCVRGLRRTRGAELEIVLVDNGSEDPRMRRYLGRMRERGLATVAECPGEFNFSWLCNEGARRASGEYLLFLNNDVEVTSPGWLARLLGLLQTPGVGIAGATLLYPDGSLQHAGIHPLADGRWVHPYRGRPGDEPGQHGELGEAREVPAVTAACLLLRRTLFDELGGFNERLPLTYNDVDLCCRARRLGWRTAVSGRARLLHYESLSRGWADDRPGSGHLEALPADLG